MNMALKLLPFLFALLLCVLSIFLWPHARIQDVPLLAWINIALLLLISVSLCIYGIYLIRQIAPPPGSRLRAKLVLGLIGMLLIPAGTLQLAANQMVAKGMNTWFDMRVDTLLDRALHLAQGFYSRIEHNLRHNIQEYAQDASLAQLVADAPLSYHELNAYLNDIIHHENWQSLELYDRNERLITALQLKGLANITAKPWSEQARLSFTLGKVSSELIQKGQDEYMVAYAPIIIQQHVIALLKARITMPHDLVEHARAVETDYRTYRALERNRQSIHQTFTQTMLFFTLWVVIAVGIIAILFSRRLTRPIGQLARALEQVTQGDLNVHIPQAPDDDLGTLVLSFNRMASRLKQNIHALEQVQNDLKQTLSKSRQRQYVLETLLNNLQSGVVLMNQEQEIRLINQAFRQLFALPEAQWQVGASFECIAMQALPDIQEFYSELRHQTHHSLQRELSMPIQGKMHHILARGERLKPDTHSDGFSGYLLLFDDVTELAEAQTHRAWAEVAQRLAHEIKNPLTPIQLNAERLQRRFREQVEPVDIFDRCTGAIITQTQRLQRLISDFSTLARLPEPTCKPTLCNTLLHELHDLYSAYPRVHIQTPDASMYALCDADQIRQVIINLMDNALAATEQGNHAIRVSMQQTPRDIEIHVEDDGEGIDPCHQQHLFDAYYSTKAEGSGLGLSIAKRIADEHQGNLCLLASDNSTHFCLSLPTTSPTPQQQENP